MAAQSTDFEPWLTAWGLEPDGAPFRTPYAGAWLLPVRQGGRAAMLKVSRMPEEQRGARLMAWWAGDGAAEVLAHDGDALLLERLEGRRSLAAMARSGQDDEASRILCGVGDRLHAKRAAPPPADLLPLDRWLRALPAAAQNHGTAVNAAAGLLGDLLALDEEPCVLHGDLHHENVLDGGDRGWLAIDPKGITGPRAYDYANILCNPGPELPLAPGRLDRQLGVVAEAARLEPTRLLQWLLVHAAVAGVWCVQDGFDPKPAFALAEMAAARLGLGSGA
jgi:streptomycin 6-kinase